MNILKLEDLKNDEIEKLVDTAIDLKIKSSIILLDIKIGEVYYEKEKDFFGMYSFSNYIDIFSKNEYIYSNR